MNSKELVKTLLSDSENTSSIWEKTWAVLYDVTVPSTTAYEDSRKFCKALNQVVTNHLEDTCDSMLPDSGPNRVGTNVDLRKKNGSFKWSTWSGSSRMMQNLSDFGKAIYLGVPIVGTDSTLLSRGEIRASFPANVIPGNTKTPYQRYSDLLHEAKAVVIPAEHIGDARKLAQDLYIQMMELGNEDKSGVS